MTVGKPIPKSLLQPVITGPNERAMNQSNFQAITYNVLQVREKLQGVIGFASHWLKNWREIFKLITKRSNRNRSRVIKFDSHLKTALIILHF